MGASSLDWQLLSPVTLLVLIILWARKNIHKNLSWPNSIYRGLNFWKDQDENHWILEAIPQV